MKRKIGCFVLLFAALALVAQDQQPAPPQGQSEQGGGPQGRRGGMMMRGRGVGGTISAIDGGTLTLQTRDGGTATVKTSADTKFQVDGKEAKLSDFKVGERVMVAGTKGDGDTWTAERVMSNPAMEARMREGLGKEFIAGKVKSIDGTNITVDRIDGQTQTIAVDESTSFRKQRESITLADIKVGDQVFGRGAVKDGTFVASQLNVGEPGRMMGGPRGPRPEPQ